MSVIEDSKFADPMPIQAQGIKFDSSLFIKQGKFNKKLHVIFF